jgi:hypothetical protein
MSRCRICSANDREQLIEDMAREMWNTQKATDPADEWRPSEKAGLYWQTIMRQFAEATLGAITREHGEA